VKPLVVSVPHRLSREEMRQKLDQGLARARDQYGDTVGEIDARWTADDRMTVAVKVMGMAIDGSIQVLPEELLVEVQLPGMASMFAGQIRDGIQQRLGGLVGSQPA
jgi:hypothetical protein